MRGDAFQVLPRTVEGARFINRWASCLQRELPGSPPLGAGRCDRPVDWRGLYRALHPRTTPYFWSSRF
jgi:hypothetical protein